MEGVRFAFGNKLLMLARVVTLSSFALSHQGLFGSNDIRHVQDFWNSPGRFFIQAPPERTTTGPWVVRLSPDGSYWLGNYNAARGAGKNAVQRAGLPSAELQKQWDAWIVAKVNYDRYNAGIAVAEANSRYLGHDVSNTIAGAPDPGPEPDSLVSFAGRPPDFAAAVVPNQYLVNFPDGSSIKIADNPPMRANFPAYRFPQGVMSAGVPVRTMPAEELNGLFDSAGVDPSAQKVMRAVSLLEGGFDSVNTYDTGFVSVGLIQFACLSTGSGSLGHVLQREKANDPEAFQNDFHQYGLDVTDTASLVALDLENGSELTGGQAARQIINDKRLVAVFQHAGQTSRAFRVAQIQIAKEQYFPANDVVSFVSDGQPVQCKVCDFIHSEAGLATLMDRKVNTGKIDPLQSVVSQIALESGCHTPADLSLHEREIVLACKYRKDFTLDNTLTQPAAGPLSSRRGSRYLKRKKTS
jgi:hypothetical protein